VSLDRLLAEKDDDGSYSGVQRQPG